MKGAGACVRRWRSRKKKNYAIVLAPVKVVCAAQVQRGAQCQEIDFFFADVYADGNEV